MTNYSTMAINGYNTVVVTGGLGFIGSNLARELVSSGLSVHIIDSELESYGSNRVNISGIKDEVTIHSADVRNRNKIVECITSIDPDAIFHLAAQLSRPMSLEEPTKDIDINCKGTINILESAKAMDNSPDLIFTSSQAVYGVPQSIPIDEETPAEPIDIYGANKLAGEGYLRTYSNRYDIDTTVCRLTNVYGPRAQLSNPKYGVINKFIRNSINDGDLTVYEPGEMLRDFVYVGDVINAFIKILENRESSYRTYLIGSGRSVSIKQLANMTVKTASGGSVKIVPWPDDWEGIRIGDITADTSKFEQEMGWEPETNIKSGLEKTISYYKDCMGQYC